MSSEDTGGSVPRDRHARPMGDLRISVTDQCNLRCSYCMPEPTYTWLPKPSILRFEELARIVDAFTSLGVTKVRLTGGEPLLRRELPKLVRMIADNARVEDLAMTTNGTLLREQLPALAESGLGRLTVSLDTLRPDRFEALTRRNNHGAVIEAIEAIAAHGLGQTKIDAVVIRGINDDELGDLIEFGARVGAEVRFIEYMDVGGATQWASSKVVSLTQMLETIEQRFGPVEALGRESQAATARRYRLANGACFGIVSSTTQPFCGDCNRSRLTADGTWYLCLYAAQGVDLRGPLRDGITDAQLQALVRSVWEGRSDRGAEQRSSLIRRGPSVARGALTSDPRLEMHTRGG